MSNHLRRSAWDGDSPMNRLYGKVSFPPKKPLQTFSILFDKSAPVGMQTILSLVLIRLGRPGLIGSRWQQPAARGQRRAERFHVDGSLAVPPCAAVDSPRRNFIIGNTATWWRSYGSTAWISHGTRLTRPVTSLQFTLVPSLHLFRVYFKARPIQVILNQSMSNVKCVCVCSDCTREEDVPESWFWLTSSVCVCAQAAGGTNVQESDCLLYFVGPHTGCCIRSSSNNVRQSVVPNFQLRYDVARCVRRNRVWMAVWGSTVFMSARFHEGPTLCKPAITAVPLSVPLPCEWTSPKLYVKFIFFFLICFRSVWLNHTALESSHLWCRRGLLTVPV